jgi:hypothetical protein
VSTPCAGGDQTTWVALDPGFAPGRNLVRDAFLDEATRALYIDRRAVALSSVAGLRETVGADIDDPATAALVGELSVRSDDFRAMWSRHDVRAKTTGMKRYRHPTVGELELDYQTLAVNGAPGQTIHVFSAPSGTPAADAMRLLATDLAGDADRVPGAVGRAAASSI